MKKIYGIVAFGLLGASFWLTAHSGNFSRPIMNHRPLLAREPAAIGTKDDPEARQKYELRRLRDPATGKIPAQIRAREQEFATQLPTKESLAASLKKFDETSSIQVANWVSRGPQNVGGRTRALAVDVGNANLILAGGVSGGMWRSINGGATWTKTTAASALHSVSCIAQDTRVGKRNIWYYGTGEFDGNSAGGSVGFLHGDGIFKSTDGGATWTQLPATISGTPQTFDRMFDYVWNMATDPSEPAQNEVYAATYGGIMRSTNGGTTWEPVLGNFSNGAYYTDVVVTDTGVVYAALSHDGANKKGIWRSPDGINWTDVTTEAWPPFSFRTVIDVAPSNPNVVYLLSEALASGPSGHSLLKYTYVSGNGAGAGGTWVDRSANLPMYGEPAGDFDSQQSYDLVIKVKPDNADAVFIGGTNLYRSTDGFASTANTKWIGGYDSRNLDYEKYPNHHPDQHALAFAPANAAIMYSGHDGGVSKTTDNLANSVTWTSLSGGYTTSQFYTVAIDEATSGNNTIIGGLQDNGTWFTNTNAVTTPWRELMGGDGAFCAIAYGRRSYYASFQNGVVMRLVLNDAGLVGEWTRVDPTRSPTAAPYLFINPFVLNPNNSNVMYLAGGDRIWRNSNLTGIPLFSQNTTGVNWTVIPSTILNGSLITALDVSQITGNRLYFGTSDGKVFRVDSSSWQNPARRDVWTGKGFPANAYVNCIAVDPSNADHVFAVFSNYSVVSLFYTSNGGASWTPVVGNLEQNPDGSGNGPSCRWVEILHNEGTTTYFVGTSTGLYSTTKLNGAATVWAQEGASTIGNVVVDMITARLSDGLVVAATHGNGVFSAQTPAYNSSITVLSPAAGAFWPAGTQRVVTWTSKNLPGNVHIQLLTNDGATSSLTSLASGRPNDGVDTVTVPRLSSTNCRVQVKSVLMPSISGLNPGKFTVMQQDSPTITVLTPKAGAVWNVGSSQLVTWATFGVTGGVNIKLYTGNSPNPITLAANVPNSETKTVQVPIVPHSTTSLVRVESAANPSIFGNNPGFFTVSACPPIWQVYLGVRDGSDRSVNLHFGQSAKAENGLDPECGEAELFPTPPSGIFDARFELPVAPVIASLKDFRNDSTPTPRWRLRFQVGTAGPISFSWNSEGFPAGDFFLRDEITGALVNVNMKSQSNYTLTNPGITSLRIGPPEVYRCSDVVVNNGWNLVAVPLLVVNMSANSLYPNAISPAYGYDNGYVETLTLQNGKGYWIKFTGGRSYRLCGELPPRTISVNAGWNIIGPFESNVQVAAMTSIPPGIVASSYYGYTNGFYTTKTLTIGRGHWVKVKQSGSLTLLTGMAVAKSIELEKPVSDTWPQILIEDASGQTGRLYLAPANEMSGNFDLPPTPPQGIFDVRFSSERFVESLAEGTHEIRISSAQYPIRIKTQNFSEQVLNVRDLLGGNIVNETLAAGKEITITAAVERLQLTSATLPARYALSQNAPNPFNPTTLIKYALPEKAHVKISVYNIKGEKIADLIDEEKIAGYHQVQFNARGVASGVYFYVMQSGAFRELKKMMIVK